jgi:hypothetical protein
MVMFIMTSQLARGVESPSAFSARPFYSHYSPAGGNYPQRTVIKVWFVLAERKIHAFVTQEERFIPYT